MATIALTNLITNGSFELNVNGWSGFLTNNQNAQSTLAPTRVTPPLPPSHDEYGIAAAQIGTKTQGVVYMNPTANLGAIVGHKYYVRSQIRLRGTTPGVVSVASCLNALNPVTGANVIPQRGTVALTPLESGLQTTNTTEWTLIDAIWPADTVNFNPRWVWQTTANSGNNDLYGQLDNVVIVDLTAAFGAGNEPPLFAIREGVRGYTTSGYWDGTADIEMPIPPVIATDTIPFGLKGRAYSAQIALVGGTGTAPFSYSLSGLPLGNGLSIDGNGAITGIINLDEGQYDVTVQLTDAIGYQTSKAFLLDIGEPPVIHDEYIPSATFMQPYSFTPDVTGSDGNLIVSLVVTSGTLPTGLSISGATISGTPLVDGQTCQITITAYNNFDLEGVSKTFTLGVYSVPKIDTLSPLRNATQDIPYSLSFVAAGIPPITWEFLSGDLPPGLTLSETGVLSGTPTQTGVYSFSVRAINDLGEDTRLFELNVYALPVITTVSLGYARLGSPYSGQLTAAGSTPMTWAVISGSLPTGLSLNANTGAITGVPLASGRFTFTVAATNIAGNSAPAQFIVDAGLALAIVTTSPLRSATVNVLYGALQFVAEGIDTSATVAWSVGAGTTLPQGMTLSTAGVLSGTPASTGTYNFSITITNGAAVATSPFTLFVGAPPVITSPPVLGGGVDRPFTTVLSASGSTPITWTMTAGPAWTGGPKPPPPTIDITLASNGVLSWLIPTEGNYTFTAVAANEFGNSAPVVFFLDITTPGIKTTAVKNGIVGEAYLEYILASGDQPFTWSLVSGALPPGLTWDTAIVTDPDTATPTMAFRISGTPTSTGEYSFAVRVSNFGGFAEESFTLTVYAKPVITTASLNSGNVNAVYSQTLQATGTTPIAWSILPPAGSETGLPPGLSLSGATISGIPAAEGIYTFTVRAQNSTGSGYANEKQFSIAIGPSGAPVITTGSTLSAIRGTAFSVALAANGNQPISWALEGGSSLPNGITLVDNALSGTPTTAGVYTFVITATNANGVDSRTYIMTIADPPVITTASLEDGATGVAYSQALSATGDAPISWTVVTPLIAGETGLPPGLSLNANTGIISGTPGASGIFSFRIRAVNGAGYDVAPLTIDVIESFFHETILDGEIVGGFFLDGEEIFAIVISGDIVYLSN